MPHALARLAFGLVCQLAGLCPACTGRAGDSNRVARSAGALFRTSLRPFTGVRARKARKGRLLQSGFLLLPGSLSQTLRPSRPERDTVGSWNGARRQRTAFVLADLDVYCARTVLRPFLLSLLAFGVAVGCARQASVESPAARGVQQASELPSAVKQLRIERSTPRAGGTVQPVLRAMQAELHRSLAELGRQDTPPYYLAYAVEDSQAVSIQATEGVLLDSVSIRSRVLDASVRVGSHQLDNTHGDQYSRFMGITLMPFEDDPIALRTAIWLATERSYRDAAEALIQVRAAKTVEAEEEDDSPDFSREEPTQHLQPPARLTVDRSARERQARRLSALFRRFPELEDSYVNFEGSATTRYFVNSERTLLQTPHTSVTVSLGAQLTTSDGMELSRDEHFYAHTAAALPPEQELVRQVERITRDLIALKAAPQGEPYIGPAILDGLAAAVLFHEVLGHRAEGHRQKLKWEGKTFTKMVGERVMPPGFNVFDDPRIRKINGIDLNGFYEFDTEGVAAQSVDLVEDGVFRGFLMSRMPIRDFSRSNGHGRGQFGLPVVARQANLVVEPARVTTSEALKQALIAEVKRQGKPYGLRVSKVTGGDTQTGVFNPQAFQVRPVMVYRVFPDGTEELVRGVKLEGTPLSLLSNVVAAANDFAVFNGICGAESGPVPVSAVSPSLMVSRIEVARAPKGTDRPPLLSPPSTESSGGAQ